MVDVFSVEKRSEIMSRIKGRGNAATELKLIALFRKHQVIGWRRNYRLFGKPDFVFPKNRVVVFVDGCFWHCCPKHSTSPANNSEFWLRKLKGNRTRDLMVTRKLRSAGWRVLRIWEHELSIKSAAQCVQRIKRAIAESS